VSGTGGPSCTYLHSLSRLDCAPRYHSRMRLSSSSASAADCISGASVAGRCLSVCARHLDAHNIRVRACKRSEQGHLDQGRGALGDACRYSVYLLYWYNRANTDALGDAALASAASTAVLIKGSRAACI
jgi:hypothetical protein